MSYEMMDEGLRLCDFCMRTEATDMIAGTSDELLEMREIKDTDDLPYIVCVDCEKKGVMAEL